MTNSVKWTPFDALKKRHLLLTIYTQVVVIFTYGYFSVKFRPILALWHKVDFNKLTGNWGKNHDFCCNSSVI